MGGGGGGGGGGGAWGGGGGGGGGHLAHGTNTQINNTCLLVYLFCWCQQQVWKAERKTSHIFICRSCFSLKFVKSTVKYHTLKV